jgi:hypothetical protein
LHSVTNAESAAALWHRVPRKECRLLPLRLVTEVRLLILQAATVADAIDVAHAEVMAANRPEHSNTLHMLLETTPAEILFWIKRLTRQSAPTHRHRVIADVLF